MKNIILQHWSGNLNELVELSTTNISKYAQKINADYKFLRENIFHPKLSPPCQKLYMLNKEFDEYDMVVMLDSDMFVRKGMTENVFTDVEGIGRHTEIQDHLMRKMHHRFPNLTDPKFPYWGGSIYRLTRELRQLLRQHIVEENLLPFSNNYEDEGIMHHLAMKAGLEITEKTYLPGNHWNCGSFEKEINDAAIIHIRTKIAPGGPKREKIENYRDLVLKGLIEG